MSNIQFKILGVPLVAVAIAMASVSTGHATSHTNEISAPASPETEDFEAGRDFIKAAVFGVGPMVDEVSDAVADPQFDAFVAGRSDTAQTNAHLDALLAAYAKRRPGSIERVGEASRSGNPYLLDVATSRFLDQLEPISKKIAARQSKKVSAEPGVAPQTAHSLAVVPIAVALAAYMYAAVAHTAGLAIQVGAGFAYYVYSKVKFWGVAADGATDIEHEELMLRLAEGLATR